MYDSLRGEGSGDELYVEGMDDAFLEWRAQHGQEWARYYGLTVSGFTFAVYLECARRKSCCDCLLQPLENDVAHSEPAPQSCSHCMSQQEVNGSPCTGTMHRRM